MTNRYDSLIAAMRTPHTVTDRELAARAAQSVQTSIFQRLRRASGGPLAGRLAWMLIRSAQPDHNDHCEAYTALSILTGAELAVLLKAATGARDSMKDAAARALAGDIVDAVRGCGGVAAARELPRAV